jgi:hypothetical protein
MYLHTSYICGRVLYNMYMYIYTGKFRNGVPHGWCVKTLANGDVFTGGLVSGRREGFGQYVWVCGDVYTGMLYMA